MSLILNIETASTNCSVSLAKNGQTLAIKEDNDKNYSHSERLHVYINTVLKQSKFSLNDISAVAVSKGPGSYTGLRIGVSAAKGLCYALDIPLISVETLKSLAKKVKIESGYIIPMLDARRLEVYSSIFDQDFKEIRETKAEILSEDSYEDFLNSNEVFFIGSGVEKCKSIIKSKNVHFIENKLPSAEEMSYLSYQEYKKGNTEDVAYFEPYYLKDFVAIKPKP